MYGYVIIVAVIMGFIGGYLGGMWAYRHESDKALKRSKKELDEVEAELHKELPTDDELDSTLESMRE